MINEEKTEKVMQKDFHLPARFRQEVRNRQYSNRELACLVTCVAVESDLFDGLTDHLIKKFHAKHAAPDIKGYLKEIRQKEKVRNRQRKCRKLKSSKAASEPRQQKQPKTQIEWLRIIQQIKQNPGTPEIDA